MLTRTLREWQPRLVSLAALGLAVCWNMSPLAASYAHARGDPAAHRAYWAPAIRYLHRHLTPSYRVEVVDTTGHWGAVYLPRAGIPLARGWFRQDDFPQNRILYSRLGPEAYLGWLRRLGVRFVVLTRAPSDYSARGEARLLRSGRSGLRPVLLTPRLTVFEVPRPQRIVTGPTVGAASVLELTQTRVALQLREPGRYRVALRYSPYWRPSSGCVSKRDDGMIELVVPRGGLVRLRVDVDAGSALHELAGRRSIVCAPEL